MVRREVGGDESRRVGAPRPPWWITVTLHRQVARRIALGFATAYVVLSVVFLLLTQTRDTYLGGLLGTAMLGAAGEGADADEMATRRQEIHAEYLAERNLDGGFLESYANWMLDMFTLRWGRSTETGDVVTTLVLESVLRTAAYVLPAMAIAVVTGLALGVYAAMRRGSRGEEAGRAVTYVLFGLPNFWIGAVILLLLGIPLYGGDGSVVSEHLLPVALLSTTLLAGQVSYARSESLEYVSADFVKLVRAKGGSDRLVARHVLRNAAIPMFSLFFTEMLAVLVISVFVIEYLFGIAGFGTVLYDAVVTRDFPVVLGSTLVVIAIGVLGNVVQDVGYGVLDPRVDTGTRR